MGSCVSGGRQPRPMLRIYVAYHMLSHQRKEGRTEIASMVPTWRPSIFINQVCAVIRLRRYRQSCGARAMQAV